MTLRTTVAWLASHRRASEYQRTCRACGTRWTLSRRLAHARPPSGHRRGYALADMRGAGAKAFSESHMQMLGGIKDHRDAAADYEVEILVASQRCPRCRSEDYAQIKCPRRTGTTKP